MFVRFHNLTLFNGFAVQFKDILKATDNPHSEPGKPISASFEPHMSIFVDAQDKWVCLFITYKSPLLMDSLGFLPICLRLTGRARETNRSLGRLQRRQLGKTARLQPWQSSHHRRIYSISMVKALNNALNSRRGKLYLICALCIRNGFGFMLVKWFSLQVSHCRHWNPF